MATLTQTKSGCWSIQYAPPGERRKTITLPRRFDKRTAESMRDAVKKLLFFQENGLDYRTEDKRLRTWVEEAGTKLRDKLADHGLIKVPKRLTVQEFWDGCIAHEKTKGVEDTTIDTFQRAQERFLTFFKEDDWIADLTEDQMIAWKEALKERYKEATIAGTLDKTRTAFNWAKRKQYIEVNPLKDVDKGSYKNEANDRYIPMHEYYRLLDVAICQEWRVIFALARIGGLRAPSEILEGIRRPELGLRWSQVDWDNNRFTFADSKRKDKERKPYRRTVPLFPALRVELEALWERDREMNPEFVINRYRGEKTNLGTRFKDAALAAGLDKIPRPFDNMRASRSIEIDREFGPKIESEWIGHSEKTAHKHYFMVTEDDFARAMNWESNGK